MQDMAQVLGDRCFNLAMEIQNGIRPASMTTAWKYLDKAMLWAIRRNDYKLAARICECLNMAWPREILDALSNTQPKAA